jgi:hypothetical protein
MGHRSILTGVTDASKPRAGTESLDPMPTDGL